MNIKTFNEVVKSQFSRCEDILVQKQAEYSSEFDKLHNFKQSSHLQQRTQAQALGGKMAKHTVSIYDMIATGKSYPLSVWDEKITDHINYLILLRAVVEEEDG